MRNLFALVIIAIVAGSVCAADITMYNEGAPDFAASGGPAFPSLQRLVFQIAREPEAPDLINAASMTITTAPGQSARIHQVFAKSSGSASGQFYADSPQSGDVSPSAQLQLDTYCMDSLFSQIVVAADEDILGLTEGDNVPAFTGPFGPAETYLDGLLGDATDTGFGTFYEFAGAVSAGQEHEGYDAFQVVLPSDLIWNYGPLDTAVTVTVSATSPLTETTSLILEFAVAPMAGDLNNDGFVGGDDLNIVLGAWGSGVTAGDWLAGDPSGDGAVGGDDLNIVLGNWGGVPPGMSAGTVPEPASIALMVTAGLVMAAKRGRAG